MNRFDVSVYAIRRRAGRRRPFEVRWQAAGRSRSKSFITRKLADGYRAELVRAARMGLDFDPLPRGALPPPGLPPRRRRAEEGRLRRGPVHPRHRLAPAERPRRPLPRPRIRGHARRLRWLFLGQTALLQSEANTADQRIYAMRRGPWPPLSATRPCVPGSTKPRTGERLATDGRDGSGYDDRPPDSLPHRPFVGGRLRAARRHDPAGFRQPSSYGREGPCRTGEIAQPTPAAPDPRCDTG